MAVDDVKAKVQRIITDWKGSVSIDRDGDFFFKEGSAVVYISVVPWGDDLVLVKLFSILVLEAPMTPELTMWIATEGQYYWFGKTVARVDSQGSWRVNFEHTLLGDFLDPEELRQAARVVGTTADEIDDVIVQKFGGRRFGG